jgi:hypothetical protein
MMSDPDSDLGWDVTLEFKVTFAWGGYVHKFRILIFDKSFYTYAILSRVAFLPQCPYLLISCNKIHTNSKNSRNYVGLCLSIPWVNFYNCNNSSYK